MTGVGGNEILLCRRCFWSSLALRIAASLSTLGAGVDNAGGFDEGSVFTTTGGTEGALELGADGGRELFGPGEDGRARFFGNLPSSSRRRGVFELLAWPGDDT